MEENHLKELLEIRTYKLEIAEKRLAMCKEFMRGWCYSGYNGSPFPDQPRQELQTRYCNYANVEFNKIFEEKPQG